MVTFLLFVFLNSCSATSQQQGTPTQTSKTETISPTELLDPTATATVFLPLVLSPNTQFIGIYLKEYWTNENVEPVMTNLDQQTGKKHSSVGWFIDLEDDAFTIPVNELTHNNLYRQLESLWQAGYTSFINLGSDATAAQIINGDRDKEITNAANFYHDWVSLGGGRKAMIAPLQEMNGYWTSYGEASTSEQYKQAYIHIRNIFLAENNLSENVWWVFAPNGWNDPATPSRSFENYYPGDQYVDVIGFSSYNYGWCPSTSGTSGKWETYSEMLDPYITRMELMAPSKPIIIAETATTAYYDFINGEFLQDVEHKNQWLIESYNYLASKPSVAGVYYFSFSEFDGYACDFEVIADDTFFSGYKNGVSNPSYKYLSADKLDFLFKTN